MRRMARFAAGGLLLLALPLLAEDPDPARTISLNSYVFDVAKPPVLPESLRAAEGGDSELLVVKFPAPVSAEQLAALEENARIFTYLPHYAYLVRLPAGHRSGLGSGALFRSFGASWSGPWHPGYKISPGVRQAQAIGLASLVPEEDEELNVMVQVFPDVSLGTVVETLKARGVPGIVAWRSNPFFSRIRILLRPDEIVSFADLIAQQPEVFWVDVEPRRVLLNDTTVWVGQSGLSGGQTTPIHSKGIYGQGQVVAILDTGIDPDMCYFRDTTLGLPPTNACNGGTTVNNAMRKLIGVNFLHSTECAGGLASNEWDTQDHGTHVAGTVAGDNFANLLVHNPGDGMAPGAKLVIQDGGYGVNNCADLPGIGCPVVDLNPIFQQTYDQGARIHTNSWGDNENAAVQNNYTAASQDVDEFMWNHKDFLVFFAAGNSGSAAGSVGSPSTNKSGVSVGATLRGTSANSMASFSSCGPTDDGRIKPEITVPGNAIVSANSDNNTGSNNCGTQSMSGTSMATPGAAGLSALIRQYYMDGWYPSGTAIGADAFTPSAALLRATLINSGVSMTGATAIPGNCQGWGRVTLDEALFFAGDARKLRVKDVTPGFASGSSGQDVTYTFTVQSSAQPFKATLAWTDFPSTPAANPHLNNDLDLRVTGPTGTLWLGNVFSGGNSATGGSADRRNTLEQVRLQTPATGTYTVTVRSFNVPNGPQPFSLVVTGDAVEGSAPPPVTVFEDTFETNLGWTRNAGGTDNATLGLWERGDPAATTSSGAKQLGTTVSGTFDLVTGPLAGAAAGDHDLDGGLSTMRSPAIVLPATGTLTLSFSYYLAHGTNSSTADYLRVKVIGTTTSTVLEELGGTENDNGAWLTASANITAFAGQTVRIQVEAADLSGASLVEAAVDDVKIVQQP
jgi:hypothetical protein